MCINTELYSSWYIVSPGPTFVNLTENIDFNKKVIIFVNVIVGGL